MTGKSDKANLRDARFAILKVIAFLGIILAHAKPPTFIFQLRNFDVPMLVLVSGALFVISLRGRR